MKKSRLKLAVKKAMSNYYKSGLTNTAYNVQKDILSAIDKAYKENTNDTQRSNKNPCRTSGMAVGSKQRANAPEKAHRGFADCY